MPREDAAEYDREGGHVTLETAERHLSQGFAADWFAVEVSDETVIVNTTDTGASAYTLEDSSESARVLAQADAVLWDGDVANTDYQNGVVNVTSRLSGLQSRLPVDSFLEEPVPILERTDLVNVRAATEVDSDD